MKSGLTLAATQVLAQAAALGLWLLLSATVSTESQGTAVAAYGIGTVIALPLTLGIPFTLPNLYRGATHGDGTGPWTAPTLFAGFVCLLASLVGTLLAVSGQFWPAMVVASATVATAGATGAAILVVQIARIRRSTLLMLTGLALYPVAPATWLLLLHIAKLGDQRATLGFCLVMVIATITTLKLASALPFPRLTVDTVRKAMPSVLSSAPLVPHLLCFSGLMQGIRLGILLAGIELLVVPAHLVMLVVGAVTSVLTSVNAVIAVAIQTADDSSLQRSIRRNTIAYTVLSVLAATATATGLLVAPIFMSSFPRLSPSDTLLASAAAAACCFYYSLSAFVLRESRTVLLATTTVLCFVVATTLYVTIAPTTLNSSLLIFSSTMAALPLTLSVMLLLRLRWLVRQCLPLLATQAFVMLPLLATGAFWSTR